MEGVTNDKGKSKDTESNERGMKNDRSVGSRSNAYQVMKKEKVYK